MIGITFGIRFFLKQLIGTWPEIQCTMQRYVHTDDKPSKYVHIMYTQISKKCTRAPIYYMYPSLFGDVSPAKKHVNTQQIVQRGGICTISGQRDSTMFVALLGESSWTNAESHAIDSWKGWIWEFVYNFWGVLKPSLSGLGPGGLDSWDPLMKGIVCLGAQTIHPNHQKEH